MQQQVTRADHQVNIPDTYRLIKRQILPDCDAVGYLLEHVKSGARVVLMDTDDTNRTFYIAFRTPPTDSTGVAHIMEHSVLCGSKHFPLKDPFVELGKGSLNTFLNAMTYPDKTVYPVASMNETDFRNLMHVYLDAVFHPSIYDNEQIFRKEGWHYEIDSQTEALTVNGIVYNEMKGVFSSPEGVLDYATYKALFPDTSYGHESGGDPKAIPDLTYEQFIDFHRTWYHPSNSYIYLYGDLDFEEQLAWIDEAYLSEYERITVDSEIALQPAFDTMAEAVIPYSVSEEQDPKTQAWFSWSKVVANALDTELVRAFQVIDYALVSSNGAPLKKALIEAGIGQDVSGGYDAGIRQPAFSIIAKRANEEDRERFEQVIDETLQKVVSEGIDPKALEAGINTMQFSYVEGDTGRYPKGLIWGLALLDSWLYDDAEPFMHVEAMPVFETLKEKIGTGYYEDLVKRWLIDQHHGACLMLKGEPGLAEREEKEQREAMAALKAGMSDEELAVIRRDNEALQAYQESKDTPEMLETIPVLELSDISEEIEPITAETVEADVPFTFHEQPTKGIGYVDLVFDLSALEADDLAAASILVKALGMMDTEHYTYDEFGYEVNRLLGGLGTQVSVRSVIPQADTGLVRPLAVVSLKAFYKQLPAGFDLIREMLTTTKIDDKKRLKEILGEIASDMQMMIMAGGHSLASVRASAYHSASSGFKDRTGGIAFFEELMGFVQSYETGAEGLIAKMTSLCERIFSAGHLAVSCTAEREGLEDIRRMCEELAAALPATREEDRERTVDDSWLVPPEGSEAFITPGQVQYLARGGNFIKDGYRYSGAMCVLSTWLRWEYLWHNVREIGGAYGCMTSFAKNGNAFFVSYRDPHLKRTWDVFEDLPEAIQNLELSDRSLRQYVIGAINAIDQPMSPRAKGARSYSLMLAGITEEDLRRERREILSTTPQDLQELAGLVEDLLAQSDACVVGSAAKIKEDGSLFDETKALM